MNNRFIRRMQTAIESRNISVWAIGVGLIVVIALVVLGALVSASQNSAVSANMPGSNIVSSTGLFFNIMLKLGIVLLMIYVFMQLLKRWQGGKQLKQKKFLSVVETAYLNQRQALHLVKAGDKLLLIGSTDQSVSCLSELAPDILVRETEITPDESIQATPNVLNNFAAVLAQNFNKH